MGVLLLQALIPPDSLDEALVIRELSLEGAVRHSRGVLSIAAAGHQADLRVGVGCNRGGHNVTIEVIQTCGKAQVIRETSKSGTS